MNSHIIDNSKKDFFDLTLESFPQKNETGLSNLGSLLFNKLPHRQEDSDIIISHIKEELVCLSLMELRKITANLYGKFYHHSIQKGDNVLLTSLESNSEIYIAILFLALSSYGVNVFLPMYVEKDLIADWHRKVKFDFLCLPGEEIYALDHHERQKRGIDLLQEFAAEENITCLDLFKDFQLNTLTNTPPIENTQLEKFLIDSTLSSISGDEIALSITTSGTSGVSKIIAYDHKSFLINLSAWEKAGLFNKNKLGGRGFTPLFTHTMGIRSFFNALWLGSPMILINTDWFIKKPEAVCYFLSQSKPEHITGGPAVFNMILEMCRAFPELKKELRTSLKTIISSGTAINTDVIDKMRDVFNIQAHNAFGTTETQQVLNTLIGDTPTSTTIKTLGGLLPGTSIGLKKINGFDTYKMYIRSNYSGVKIIDDKTYLIRNKYIYLGDIVKHIEGNIFYSKRENQDYINDEFGFKVPLNKIKESYSDLFKLEYYIKILPLKFSPGLAALICINDNSFQNDKVEQGKIISQIHSLIEKSNHTLYNQLEPLEFNHWTIRRFSCVPGMEILNKKGITSDYKVSKLFSTLINELTEDNQPKNNIKEIKPVQEKSTTYAMYHNPYVGNLLECLDMDVSYDYAIDDYVHCIQENESRKILDLTGGYGTNLLGHHHTELINHAVNFLKSNQIPLSDQLSLQKHSGDLAEKLNEIIGKTTGKSYCTLFGSTGSEVMEMAIHHAYLEWIKKINKLEEAQRAAFSYNNEAEFKRVWNSNWGKIKNTCPAIIVNSKAFHGTSTGPRALMGDKERRMKFCGLFKLVPVFIDDTEPHFEEKIKKEVKKHAINLSIFSEKGGKAELSVHKVSTIIAAAVEPVLGEGGIREIDSNFPKILGSYDFPLIIDEIQSGLGRTGTFLASEGFVGNYYLFSKALGGNISKISAISIEKERFIDEIGKLYVSTFAGGAFASSIALETLKIIEREKVADIARLKGAKIIRKLNEVKNNHATVIEGIQGKGLMIGIKFSIQAFNDNLFLRVLHQKKVLGYLFSSYLLKNHNLRILPSLSAPNVLRIEPSVCIKEKDIDRLCTGIDQLARLVENGEFYLLSKHLLKGDPFIDKKGALPEYGFLQTNIEPPAVGAKKVVFMAHFAYPIEEFRMFSKDITQASDTGIRQLFAKFESIMDMEPFILGSKNIYNGKIHLTTILLPLDSSELEKLHKTNKREKVIRNIQKGVDLAAKNGAKVISLGGYASIITNNGKAILEPENVKVVTGNTLTAVVGYHKFKNTIKTLFHRKNDLTIGVVGATGNIGKILTRKLVDDDAISMKSLWLVGRSNTKLNLINNELAENSLKRNIKLNCSTDLKDLKRCDAIIVAVNTNDPIIYPIHIKENHPVLIADLSIPGGVAEELQGNGQVHILPFAASIKLIEDEDYLITSCSPRGTALCCTAEAFLNAFENTNVNLRGDITYQGFNIIDALARKYGFIQHIDNLRTYKSTISHELSV